MLPWDRDAPSNLEELFIFYTSYVKHLLHDTAEHQDTLPLEVMSELAKALDDIAEHWAQNHPEEAVVEQAYRRFQQSCLYMFRLKVREARRQYDELRKLDTSVIEYGQFNQQLHHLFHEIRAGVREARRLEGETPDNLKPAFQEWEKVYANCVRLEQEFFYHERLGWVRQRGFWEFIKNQAAGIIIGLFTGVIASLFVWWLTTYIFR